VNSLPNLPCLCSNFRRASRALTQLYEQALRPLGLKVSQFSILQALSLAGEVTQGRLGEILVIDSTTLTRTLAIMRRQDWIAERRGKDRRERWLQLTKAGKSQLTRATSAWEETQSRLRRELGAQTWNQLFQLTHRITTSATNQGESQ
jgi:DNA-binding MarR family transcriptional regulator